MIIKCPLVPKGKFVNVAGLIFTREPKNLSSARRNYLALRAQQALEINSIMFVPALTMIFLGFSLWWFLLIPMGYHIWYAIEWSILWHKFRDNNLAKENVCFHAEAIAVCEIQCHPRVSFDFLRYLYYKLNK